MHYKDIISNCWNGYKSITPSAEKIHSLLKAQGETVHNDHIAFRTFNDPKVNISILSKALLSAGYVEKGQYHFEQKKLNAKHFEHPDMDAPKVFISELILEAFSPELNKTIKGTIGEIPEHIIGSSELLYSGRLWENISFETYSVLLKESEYAAWLYVYGFCVNHFTININALKEIHSVQEINDFIVEHGFKLNVSGGEIKGSPELMLEQSSTLADKKEIDFIEGKYTIPSCYYEFAKRYNQPNGELFQGFVAQSADKIFESTNNKKREDARRH